MEFNHDAHMHFVTEPIIGHKTIDPIDTYIQYFKTNSIKTAFIVFSDAEKFEGFKEKCKIYCPDTKMYGFYWIDDINNYSIPDIADALKFESYIDKIDISQIGDILTSDRRNLTIYAHCGEENNELANPLIVKELADEYKDRMFMIGHSGAYAPPIDYIYLKHHDISGLVTSAIYVAKSCDNVHLESSIINDPRKRNIMIKALLEGITDLDTLKAAKADKSHIINKFHLGTDFPLSIGDVLYDVLDKINVPEKTLTYRPTIIDQKNILIEGLKNKIELDIADEIIAHVGTNTRDFFTAKTI